MVKKEGVLRPLGEPKVDFVLFFGTPFGPKRGPKSPKADLKTIKKQLVFIAFSALGGSRRRSRRSPKTGRKTEGAMRGLRGLIAAEFGSAGLPRGPGGGGGEVNSQEPALESDFEF